MKQCAFIFPGQGSQYVGMLSRDCEIAQHYCQRASEVLGYDLLSLIVDGPDDQLNQTAFTQPALLVASVVLWERWCVHSSIRPVAMAGHSLGEYSALTCAGALAFEDAVRLVQCRGQWMQAAVPAGVGAMAAVIGLDNEKVQALCDDCAEGQVLSPANYNSIGQVVIAGHASAVDRAVVAAKSAGARMAKKIPVSVPSHCALMQPAAEQLSDLLNTLTIQAPSFPIINNVDACVAPSEADIKQALVRQLSSPVRWVDVCLALCSQGPVSLFAECGPGKVLAGLLKRIDKTWTVYSLDTAGACEALCDSYGH
jgi:[acyl-carrier-protein] S-malonyltransferase